MMNKLQLLHALYMLFNYALHSNVSLQYPRLKNKNRITDEMTFVLVVFVTWNVEPHLLMFEQTPNWLVSPATTS